MAAEQEDVTMADSPAGEPAPAPAPASTPAPPKSKSKSQKFHDLASRTLKAPPYSYAHLELFSGGGGGEEEEPAGELLDALQVRACCAAALGQFLGLAGAAVAPDILGVRGRRCWLRVPRDDLGAFCAAIAAWQGVVLDGSSGSSSSDRQKSTLRILGCSDWLGTLVGGQGEDRLWTG